MNVLGLKNPILNFLNFIAAKRYFLQTTFLRTCTVLLKTTEKCSYIKATEVHRRQMGKVETKVEKQCYTSQFKGGIIVRYDKASILSILQLFAIRQHAVNHICL